MHLLPSPNPMLLYNPSNLPNTTSPISVLRLNHHAMNPLLPNVPLPSLAHHTPDSHDSQSHVAHYSHPVATHAPHLATSTTTCLLLAPQSDISPSHPVDYLPTAITTIPIPPPSTPPRYPHLAHNTTPTQLPNTTPSPPNPAHPDSPHHVANTTWRTHTLLTNPSPLVHNNKSTHTCPA